MSYNIQIERKALKFINKQSPEQKRRILAAITDFQQREISNRWKEIPDYTGCASVITGSFTA